MMSGKRKDNKGRVLKTGKANEKMGDTSTGMSPSEIKEELSTHRLSQN